MLAALEQADALTLDFTGVGDLDSAGIQLLVSLRNEARRRSKQLRYTHGGPGVRAALELLGAPDWFLQDNPHQEDQAETNAMAGAAEERVAS